MLALVGVKFKKPYNMICISGYVFKSHNKTLLMYHPVFTAKYRRKVFTKEIEQTLVQVCIEISKRYEIHFLEIGNDEDHVHFLVQVNPTMPVVKIVQLVKSITAREILLRHKEVKKLLWGGNLWTSSFYATTVGQFASEETIRKYIQNQGKDKELFYLKNLNSFLSLCVIHYNYLPTFKF